MTSNFSTTFGQKLASRLEELRVTRYRLAKLTGLSTTHISNIVDGKRSATDEVIERVAPHIGLDVELLRHWARVDRMGEEGVRSAMLAAEPEVRLTLAAITDMIRVCKEVASNDETSLAESLEGLAKALRAVGAAVYQPDANRGYMTSVAQTASMKPYVEAWRVTPPMMFEGKKPPIYRAISEGEEVKVNIFAKNTSPGYKTIGSTWNINGLAVYPVTVHGIHIAALAVYLRDHFLIANTDIENLIRLFCCLIRTRLD